MAGIRYTADALSEERRGGTLGLLFLTDLRGFDVVLGKLAVTSLDAFFALLAIFPMLGLPVLLGGVTGIEFWRMTLVLLNTLLFSLSIGLFVSTFGQNERGVMLNTLFLLLLGAAGLPTLWKGVTQILDVRFFDLLLLFPSPIYAFKMSASGIFGGGRSDFWPSMLTIFAISVVCVSTASLLLPRRFQERRRSCQPVFEGF
ncbi:MAG: ABC transporter permease subunit, partial [Verrucomicrobiales bacterium]|nr:ABC transporter permease subunit [Verrucomicrobiales bacterium]